MSGFEPGRAVRRHHAPWRRSLWAVGIVAMALLGIAVLALIALMSGPVPFVLGLVLAIVPVPVLVAAILTVDRLEPEPTRRLVLAFVWGATVAVALAGVINTVGLSIGTVVLGAAEGKFVSMVIGGPVVEETLKAAVIVGFLRFGRQELDGPTDGVIYAGMVGVGFAMVENVLYYAGAAAQHGLGALVGTFVLRGVIAPFGHPLFTSMTGIAVGWAALCRTRAARVALPLAGLCTAIVLHALWNAAAGAGIPVLVVVYVVVLLPILLIVVAVTFLDRRRMARLIRRHLPEYADTGLMTSQDVRMLASLSARRRARSLAREQGGTSARRAMRDYQFAATELALLQERAARGVADTRQLPKVRDDLLQRMGAAREEVLQLERSTHRAG